jgi:hypothetical protein
MNKDHRSDRDVCQRRRRRGAYAAVLSAAAGAALAAAMIPAPLAYADTTDDAIGAAAAGDSVSDAIMRQTEETIANGAITKLDGDLGLASFAGPENGILDSFYAFLPGGADGTLGIDAETTVANLATDGINLLDGGGGMRMLDAAAADAVPALAKPIPEDEILDKEILTLFNDLRAPALGTGDVDFTTELLSLLPGGVNGADGVEVETLLASDLYTPALNLVDTLLGIGGGMAF